MDQIQEGQMVIVKGSPGAIMCGHMIEAIIGCRGVVTAIQDDFVWVEVDGVRYILTSEDLEIIP